MNDFSKLTKEELNKMDKHVFITIIQSLQGQLQMINNQLEFLPEQIAIMNQRSFGRKTEKIETMSGQLSLFDDYENVFNEPEICSDDSKNLRFQKSSFLVILAKNIPPVKRIWKVYLLGCLNTLFLTRD